VVVAHFLCEKFMILSNLYSVREAETKKAKAQILDDIAAKGEVYRQLLLIIFDKDIRFFVDTKKMLSKTFETTKSLFPISDEDLDKELLQLLTLLSSEELRGDVGVMRCVKFANDLPSMQDVHMFTNILENKTRLNIGATDINKYCYNFRIEQFEVMYAQRIDKIKVINPLMPYFIQPKIDGNRCICIVDGDDIQLLSRTGKVQTGIQWLAQELKGLEHPVVLDGEIEVGGTLEGTGAVRRKEEQALDAVYTIFGAYDFEQWIGKQHHDPYSNCLTRATDVVRLIKSDHIRAIQSYYLKAGSDEEFHKQIDRYKQTFIDQGYEGAMLKTVEHVYQPTAGSKRSVDWIKIKPQESTEGKILEVLEGEGEHAGMVGKFKVQWFNEEFEVSPGKIDHAGRKLIFEHKENYVGSYLEFVYQQLNAYGIPRDTHAIKIRS
jgi:hypothetical protein